MNGRLYDPVVGRFLSPDNYVQMPDFSQNFNRYSYCWNNPLKYNDPDGEWIHILVGAIIGGVINTAVHWNQIDNFWDGVKAFGVGAGGGALVAATGGAALTALGGGAAAVGGGGFIAGGLSAGVGYTYGSTFTSIGNNMFFGDPMPTAKQFFTGLGISMVTGGVFQGVNASVHGRNFFTGNLPTPMPTPTPMPALSYNLPESKLNTDGMRTQLRSMPDEGIYVLNDSKTSVTMDIRGDGIKYLRDINFRGNLIDATGFDPGGLAHAHHIFPHKYAAEFSRVGVNINRYGSWWETTSHLQNAGKYNDTWGQFFRLNTNPTKLQIYNEAIRLKNLFGY
jgi:hypothetical protein